MNSQSDKIRVSLFGAAGRMGSEVALILQQEKDCEIINLIEHPDHPAAGSFLFGLEVSGDPYDLPLAGTIFCDFTLPDAAVKNAALAAELECPILIGSTGFITEQLVYLENLGKKIPVLLAPNLSRGVNLLYRLVETAAKALAGDFEVEVIEIHHHKKQDAPSGTAKEIIRIIEKTGISHVPAHSLRMGDITGEHNVIFGGEGESLQIIHRAQSRKAFAKGVIPALSFLSKAGAGFYSFTDALNT